MQKAGGHAVVLGAGVAGLLAARVLADGYERVTVVERDRLGETAQVRRGIPQGRHAHLLLPLGTQLLDELFPGLVADLCSGGMPMMRDYAQVHFAPGGHLLQLSGPSGQPFICPADRPELEAHLRARVRALPAVEIVDRCQIVGLATTAGRDGVAGVQAQHLADGGADETIGADLVVDATGRGSRTPAWLAELGYDQPPEERLAIRLKYASRHLRLRPGALGGLNLVSVGAEPARPTGIALFAQQRDQWILTATGYDGHHPPTDPEGFLAFVEAIAPPLVSAAIRDAEPLDDIVAHGFAANVRRRYERLRRFPAGLLVLGDAICSSNPVYALGMSVAALQAAALREALAAGDRDLARRFFRAAALPVDMAWQQTVGADLALPQVPGPRPVPVRVGNAYVARMLAAAERDPGLAEQFMRVVTLQAPPRRVFRPTTALRILLGSRGVRVRDGVRVLIVGAGIAGLAAARALSAAGASVEIVERAEGPASEGSGIYLPGNAVRALAQLGLDAQVSERAVRIQRQRFADHRGRLLFEVDTAAAWNGVGPCLALHRAEVHDVLLSGARGVPIRWGVGVVELCAGDSAVAVTFSDGARESYSLVLGADGLHSTVRRIVFGPAAVRQVGQYARRFVVAWPHEAPIWSVLLGRDSSFLTIPIGDGRTYCYCDGPLVLPPPPLRVLLAGYAEPVPTLLDALEQAPGDVASVHGGAIEEVALDSWARHGVLLIGDAAHATSPNMAQGAAMALEDAVVLTRCLTASASVADGLAAYELRRRPRTQWVLRQTHRRDRTRALPPAARNLMLKRLGSHIFRAGYRPLRGRI